MDFLHKFTTSKTIQIFIIYIFLTLIFQPLYLQKFDLFSQTDQLKGSGDKFIHIFEKVGHKDTSS